MRSRFAAYALGLIDYVQRTTHPDSPHFETNTDAWTESVRGFCQLTRFETLAILSFTEDGDRATVTFRAGLTQSGHDASFTECSTFLKQEGNWLYLSGTPET